MEQSTRAPLLEMGKVGWVGDGFHNAPTHLAQPKCPVASGAWRSHGPRLELPGHRVPARGPYVIPSLLEPPSGFQGLLGWGGAFLERATISGPYWVGGFWLGKKSRFCQWLHGAVSVNGFMGEEDEEGLSASG